MFNVEMLKLARKIRSLTQTELSERIGISHSKLSKIEHGLLSPDDDDIVNLAVGLGYPVDFFLQNNRVYPASTPFHRKRSTLSIKDRDNAEAVGNLHRIVTNILLEGLEFEFEYLPKWDLDEFNNDPCKVAIEFRRKYKIPNGPIDNLIAVLEHAGVFVFIENFKSLKLDAFTLSDNKPYSFVFINSSFPGDRVRFNFAHEIGHRIMHDIETPEIEDQANKFAAELLMPEKEIRSSLYNVSLRKLAQLKRHWKVSMAALLKRAQDLKTITYNQSRYLWSQLKKDYAQKEPVFIPVEHPQLFGKLLKVYRDQLGYSINELAKLVSLSVDDFTNYYNGYLFDRPLFRIEKKL